jgi:hypothetical protein
LNRKTPERFWMEWANDELDLPYRSCSIDQAFRAYLKYAQRNGDDSRPEDTSSSAWSCGSRRPSARR